MDGGVIADIATILIFIFLCSYLYYRLGNSVLSHVVLLFTLGVAILAISDIISLLYQNLPSVDCIAGKFTAMGSLIAILGLLHLVSIFPRKSTRIHTILPSIYFISAIQIIYLFFTPHFLSCDPIMGGVRSHLWSIYALWAYSLLIFASLIPIYHIFTSITKIEKVATFYMVIGSLLVIGYLGLAQIVPMYYPEFEVFSAVHILPLMGVLFTVGLIKYGMYVMVPYKEVSKKSENLPEIRYGEINGIANIDAAYKIFRREISEHLGMVITIRPPTLIKERYSIERTPIMWLTYFRDEYDLAIVPDRLHFEATYSISNFLDNGGEIVIMDGVEYIIKNYGRRFFAEFLEEIKTVKNDATIILAVNSLDCLEGLADNVIYTEGAIDAPRVIMVNNIRYIKKRDLLIITSKSRKHLEFEFEENSEIISISDEFDVDRLLFEGIGKIEDSPKKNVYIECMDYIMSMGEEKDVMNFIKDIIDIILSRNGYVFLRYTPRAIESPAIKQFVEEIKL